MKWKGHQTDSFMVTCSTVGGKMAAFIAGIDNKRVGVMTFYFGEEEAFNLKSL